MSAVASHRNTREIYQKAKIHKTPKLSIERFHVTSRPESNLLPCGKRRVELVLVNTQCMQVELGCHASTQAISGVTTIHICDIKSCMLASYYSRVN